MHRSLSAICKPTHEVVIRDKRRRVIFSWKFGGVRLESSEGVSLEMSPSSPISFDDSNPFRVEVLVQLPPHITCHHVVYVEIQDENGVWYECEMDPPDDPNEGNVIVIPFRSDNLPVERKRNARRPQ